MKKLFITDLFIVAVKKGDKEKWFNTVLFRVVTITTTKKWFITVLLLVVGFNGIKETNSSHTSICFCYHNKPPRDCQIQTASTILIIHNRQLHLILVIGQPISATITGTNKPQFYSFTLNADFETFITVTKPSRIDYEITGANLKS